VKHDVKASFRHHLTTLKEHFAMPKTFGSSKRQCDAMLDGMALDSQAHMFVQTMKKNHINILNMDKKKDCNSFQRLWLQLSANELFDGERCQNGLSLRNLYGANFKVYRR